jgi:hypothetical protein
MRNIFDIRVLPNPFHQQTQIKVNMPVEYNTARLKLFNSTGTVIEQYTIDRNNNTVTFEADGMITGFYYYSLVKNGICLCSGKILKY